MFRACSQLNFDKQIQMDFYREIDKWQRPAILFNHLQSLFYVLASNRTVLNSLFVLDLHIVKDTLCKIQFENSFKSFNWSCQFSMSKLST